MSSSLIVAGAVVLALIAVSLAFRHRHADSAGVSPGTVEELRNALNRKQPTTRAELEADLQKIFPLIVPREYVKAGIPAPHHSLPEKDLVLTWVLLQPTTMLYLTPEEAARFDGEGLAWREKAIENLACAPGGIATHEKRSPDHRLLWVSMMQQDGLGSSRALLAPGWKRMFPEGYWLALPDRSCGMVISKSMKPPELAEVKAMVAGMYESATTPMSRCLYEPEELAVPAEWFPRRSRPEGSP